MEIRATQDIVETYSPSQPSLLYRSYANARPNTPPNSDPSGSERSDGALNLRPRSLAKFDHDKTKALVEFLNTTGPNTPISDHSRPVQPPKSSTFAFLRKQNSLQTGQAKSNLLQLPDSVIAKTSITGRRYLHISVPLTIDENFASHKAGAPANGYQEFSKYHIKDIPNYFRGLSDATDVMNLSDSSFTPNSSDEEPQHHKHVSFSNKLLARPVKHSPKSQLIIARDQKLPKPATRRSNRRAARLGRLYLQEDDPTRTGSLSVPEVNQRPENQRSSVSSYYSEESTYKSRHSRQQSATVDTQATFAPNNIPALALPPRTSSIIKIENPPVIPANSQGSLLAVPDTGLNRLSVQSRESSVSDASSGVLMSAETMAVYPNPASLGLYTFPIRANRSGPAPTRALPSLPEGLDEISKRSRSRSSTVTEPLLSRPPPREKESKETAGPRQSNHSATEASIPSAQEKAFPKEPPPRSPNRPSSKPVSPSPPISISPSPPKSNSPSPSKSANSQPKPTSPSLEAASSSPKSNSPTQKIASSPLHKALNPPRRSLSSQSLSRSSQTLSGPPLRSISPQNPIRPHKLSCFPQMTISPQNLASPSKKPMNPPRRVTSSQNLTNLPQKPVDPPRRSISPSSKWINPARISVSPPPRRTSHPLNETPSSEALSRKFREERVRARKMRDLQSLRARFENKRLEEPVKAPIKPVDEIRHSKRISQLLPAPSSIVERVPSRLGIRPIATGNSPTVRTELSRDGRRRLSSISPIMLVMEQKPIADDNNTNDYVRKWRMRGNATLRVRCYNNIPGSSEDDSDRMSLPNRRSFGELTPPSTGTRDSIQSTTRTAELEARIAAMERKNALLEAALLAVLQTSASISSGSTRPSSVMSTTQPAMTALMECLAALHPAPA
ncbi:MAG: hypothetical protein M1829_003264 [Trizodia sp. TS-e1964]|nr:MAG: hypothetical protein M1829_003264 [Trizodia sp. TS-e1964]